MIELLILITLYQMLDLFLFIVLVVIILLFAVAAGGQCQAQHQYEQQSDPFFHSNISSLICGNATRYYSEFDRICQPMFRRVLTEDSTACYNISTMSEGEIV